MPIETCGHWSLLEANIIHCSKHCRNILIPQRHSQVSLNWKLLSFKSRDLACIFGVGMVQSSRTSFEAISIYTFSHSSQTDIRFCYSLWAKVCTQKSSTCAPSLWSLWCFIQSWVPHISITYFTQLTQALHLYKTGVVSLILFNVVLSVATLLTSCPGLFNEPLPTSERISCLRVASTRSALSIYLHRWTRRLLLSTLVKWWWVTSTEFYLKISFLNYELCAEPNMR